MGAVQVHRAEAEEPMMKISAEPAETARRYAALAAYYAQHVLCETEFRCQSCVQCAASYTTAHGRFVPGQLNAPGTHYDLAVDGAPQRIVIVGQESGRGVAHTTMADRRAAIARTVAEQRFVATEQQRARTQHMKGITSALRLLFDKGLGTEYADEFITLASGEQLHLLHCFALVNYLLCAAHSTKRSKRGESTTTMRRNCNRHFRATLEILEPTVILVGGKSIWPHVRRAFDAVTQLDGPIFQATLGEQTAHIVSFTHPSAMHPHNWGVNANTPYLLETVAPAIAQLRSRL